MKYSLSDDFLNSKKVMYPLGLYGRDYVRGKKDFVPWSVEIHPTAKCNHRCIHCSYKERNESRVEMPREMFMGLIDDLIRLKVRGVYFSGGGEPCAYPYLKEAVQKLHDNGVEVAIVSNGSLFEQMGLIEVADCFNYIALSVPSCTGAMFEKITGRDYMSRVLELPSKIKTKFGSESPVVGARVVVTNLIAKEVPFILETLKDKDFDYGIFKAVRDYEDRGLGLSEEMTKELEYEIEKIHNSGGIDRRFTNLDTIFTYKKPYQTSECCHINYMGLLAAVTPEGDVYPNITEIGNQEFRVGNIGEKKFSDIWNSPAHEKVKEVSNKQWKSGQCKNCRAIGYNVIIENMLSGVPREEDPFL